MSISENHGSDDSEVRHSQTHLLQSIFISLEPVLDLKSRTGASVVVENIGTIFWDAFEQKMRLDGRDIGSFQLKFVPYAARPQQYDVNVRIVQ